MSTEILTQALLAGEPATFGAGTMFLLFQSTDPVSIVASTLGNSSQTRKFTNVPAGFKFQADAPTDGFDYLTVTSATDQNVSIAIGTDNVTFSNQVTVTGDVTTTVLPSSTIVDNPKVETTAGVGDLVAENLSRKRVRIYADPANTGTVYVRAHGGANNLGFLQPGTDDTFETTAALDFDSTAAGAAQTLYIFEEE